MPKTTPTAMAAKPDASFVRSPSPYGGSKAVIRDLRNYLAGQVVGITRDEALLDEILKCAFCRVSLERRGVTTNSMSEDAVAALYGQTFGDLHQKLSFLDLGSDLRLGPPHIAKVDQALSGLRILDPARDVVGDLYETFAGQSIRGQEGQFFTPKNAVQALVAMVRPTSSDLLLDPACGAGAFLLEAADSPRTLKARSRGSAASTRTPTSRG